MGRRLLPASRYMIIVAVVAPFLLATTLIIYAGVEAFQLVWKAFTAGRVSTAGAKALVLASIELVELFLLGTVVYIIALGLHALFIDDQMPMPSWLEIHDLDDLKSKLTGVVIVVLGVLFLGEVVAWEGDRDLLRFGAGIALVIGALTYFLGQKPKRDRGDG